ncbi:MAG TPA: EAL domain-containing protein [Gammaproteobacteria bacterium]|nr:EAL domain-containing protein [Gammaproteobacteria bacterium]
MSTADTPLVLVVDDDPLVRLLVGEALANEGFRLLEAETGDAALALLATQRPDLVLLDVLMPGIDGFTACSRLRVMPHGQHVPVLMMTGLDDVASIQHAYQVGATDFVTKPLNFTLLAFRLRYMLRAKATGDELRQSEALLASAQRLAHLGHFVFVPDAGFMTWNRQTHAVLGLPEDCWVSSLDDLLMRIEPGSRDAVRRSMTIENGHLSPAPVEFQIAGADQVLRTIVQHTVLETNEERIRIVGTFQDVTERRRAEQKIHRLAYYDRITGLPNRVMIEQVLGDLLCEADETGDGVAVLCIDLDHFQRVNDNFGHDTGNDVLAAIGRRLAGCVRASEDRPGLPDRHPSCTDLVARSGGDEYCIVLPGIVATADVEQVAQRIRESMQQPYTIGEQEFFITSSIGMAIHPADGDTPDMLLRHAELALAHAKRKGRDCAEFYNPQLNARAQARLAMETNLRQALGSDQLSLHYQPKLRVDTGELVGMEALVRWQHPTLGRISPAEFIPIAEESGLILPLGEWIMSEACRQLADWRRRGLGNLRCAVNLSAAQFRERNLPTTIARILRETGVDSSQLQLELTESLLMEDAGAAQTMLRSLRDLGLSLAVDDFGTGYSSLNYLKRLPLDVLKIDQSFIRELREDSDDAAIVEAVIAMAHSLRLGVVAEGVELDHQLEFLRAHHCDEVQGYLFSKPLPAAEFLDWVRRRQLRRVPAAS